MNICTRHQTTNGRRLLATFYKIFRGFWQPFREKLLNAPFEDGSEYILENLYKNVIPLKQVPNNHSAVHKCNEHFPMLKYSHSSLPLLKTITFILHTILVCTVTPLLSRTTCIVTRQKTAPLLNTIILILFFTQLILCRTQLLLCICTSTVLSSLTQPLICCIQLVL